MTEARAAREMVILFGAGASAGTAPHAVPRRPPLGRELYDELASFAPETWGPSSFLGRQADVFRLDFEQAMNDLIPRVPSLEILEWLKDLSRYFAQFALDDTYEDPYSRLLQRLHEREAIGRCVFASLNYEVLLELAGLRMGLRVAYERPEIDAMEVLKIHGSCNFVTDDLTKKRYLLTNPGGAVGCGYRAILASRVTTELQSTFAPRGGCFPVTSLYAWGKNTPVAGVQIQAMRNRFTEAVRNAAVVVIVGVRPISDDAHVWSPIRETTADVWCVGSADLVNGWRSANSRANSIGDRFESSIDRILDCLPI